MFEAPKEYLDQLVVDTQYKFLSHRLITGFLDIGYLIPVRDAHKRDTMSKVTDDISQL